MRLQLRGILSLFSSGYTVGLIHTREKRNGQCTSTKGGLLNDRTSNNSNYYGLSCKIVDIVNFVHSIARTRAKRTSVTWLRSVGSSPFIANMVYNRRSI
jgi:hypothetical protein